MDEQSVLFLCMEEGQNSSLSIFHSAYLAVALKGSESRGFRGKC